MPRSADSPSSARSAKRDATSARLSTPPGAGGIAVIRLEGPHLDRLLGEVFQPYRDPPLEEGRLALGRLVGLEGEVLDEPLVVRTAGAAEINIHGGPVVARAVLDRLARAGAEPAPAASSEDFPPEHPRWSNPAIGREMLGVLSDLIGRRAVERVAAQWSGGLSELSATLAKKERLEASDAEALRSAAAGFETMRKLIEPPEVVLAGPPNAGKSTLANALVGRVVSIVHDRAGTTRDWVRELALLGGLPVWLTDTAGLWEASHPVDAEAVRRAWDRIAQADLVLLLGVGQRAKLPAVAAPERLLHVATQIDRVPPPADADEAVSVETGDGLEHLANRVLQELGLAKLTFESPAAFTPRQRDLLRRAADAAETGETAQARESLHTLLADPFSTSSEISIS